MVDQYFYAPTTNESTQHLVAIIQAFKQCHPSHPSTKVLTSRVSGF